MIKSINLVFLCFYLLFRPLFRAFKKLGQKSVKKIVGFLEYEKTRKNSSEIN